MRLPAFFVAAEGLLVWCGGGHWRSRHPIADGAGESAAEFRGMARRRTRAALRLWLRSRRRAAAMPGFAALALLGRPLLLLFGRHHAPDLSAGVLADHFELLLLGFVAEGRILLRRRDLLLGVVPDGLDLRFLLVGKVERRIVFRRVRVHRLRTAPALRGGSRVCRGRRTAALLRARRACISENQCQSEKQTRYRDRFHWDPFQTRLSSCGPVVLQLVPSAILPPVST